MLKLLTLGQSDCLIHFCMVQIKNRFQIVSVATGSRSCIRSSSYSSRGSLGRGNQSGAKPKRISEGHGLSNRQLSEALRKKTGLIGTVLSTRSVPWASNMPQMRWWSSRRSPRPPSRLGRGITPPQSSSPRRFRSLVSCAFGAQLLCPQCKNPRYAPATSPSPDSIN